MHEPGHISSTSSFIHSHFPVRRGKPRPVCSGTRRGNGHSESCGRVGPKVGGATNKLGRRNMVGEAVGRRPWGLVGRTLSRTGDRVSGCEVGPCVFPSSETSIYLSIYLSIVWRRVVCVHPRDDFGRPRLWPRVHLSIPLSILTTIYRHIANTARSLRRRLCLSACRRRNVFAHASLHAPVAARRSSIGVVSST